jgi:DNA-binding Lrp family transcriptional regulator
MDSNSFIDKRETMKDLELRLLSELMKNCRRSDRELATVLRVSQPTVSRTLKKLEREGYIKEYTIIPDFKKLGYELMGITSVEAHGELFKEDFEEVRKMTVELEKTQPHASLMAVSGNCHDRNRLFIAFYENYSAYSEAMRLTRRLPFVNVGSMETFLVDLADETNHRVLSMAAIAQHLLKKSQKKP